MSVNVAGVDIGGSHITVALVDIDNRCIVKETISRQSVNPCGLPDEIISNWSMAIKQTFRLIPNEAYIGIAMPGPFDYENGISYIKEQDKYKSLYGLNVKEALSKQLNIAPENIHFTNDALAFLKGEVFAGTAQNYKNIWGFTLGTGLGSAFCNDENVVDGNLWCLPYKQGIAEDYFSTRWFIKRYEEKKQGKISGVKELENLYKEDIAAKEIFDEFGYNFADFIIHISKQITLPKIIVLGGNISKGYQYFQKTLMEQLNRYNINLTITPSSLQENASLIGAASYWNNKIILV